MDKNVQMEARVWSRVMNQKAEAPAEKTGLSCLLSSEYADLAVFRCLCRRDLAALTEDNIKILKTLYYVETGRCFHPEKGSPVKLKQVCAALREMYKKLKNDICQYETMGFEYEKIVKNKRKQVHIITCLLRGKV